MWQSCYVSQPARNLGGILSRKLLLARMVVAIHHGQPLELGLGHHHVEGLMRMDVSQVIWILTII